MSLHNDLAHFLLSRNPVAAPIIAAYAALNPPVVVVATDQRVLQRVCFGQGPQNVGSIPYLVFTGPFSYDAGIVSEGAVGQKVARYWLTAYHLQFDLALDWLTAIERDLVSFFVPGIFSTQNSCRITSMTYCFGTKTIVTTDQVSQTGKELSVFPATMCYQIGWQE